MKKPKEIDNLKDLIKDIAIFSLILPMGTLVSYNTKRIDSIVVALAMFFTRIICQIAIYIYNKHKK